MTEKAGYFVRVPTGLLEGLLQFSLNGAQWRILLWVVRETYGWHVSVVPFSWYRIAKDLGMDRGGVVRAGNGLLRSKVLRIQGEMVGIEEDQRQWQCATPPPPGNSASRPMIVVSDDRSHRKAMTIRSASDDDCHRLRCQESSLFRRAKERSKERRERYKDNGPGKNDDGPQRFQNGALSEHHPAGSARPIPGKYDGLS